MSRNRNNQSFRKNGGGHPSAAFFWPVWLLGLAVAAGLWGLNLAPRDRLLAAVPRAAFAYVHGNFDTLPNGMIMDIPQSLRPNEVGIFWIYRDDTAAERSLLLRWNFGPTVPERQVLEKLGATNVDGRIYAFTPSEAAVQDIRNARWGEASLSTEPTVRRALAYAGALMPAQAYVEPLAILHAPPAVAALLAKAPPTVLGLDIRQGLRAFSLPAATAAKIPAALAQLPMPSTGGHYRSNIPAAPADASFVVRLPEETIDPLTFIVGTLDGGGADVSLLSKQALQAAVRGSFSASLAIKNENISSYYAFFPGTSAKDLTERITGYLAIRYPTKKTTRLPDGASYTELIANREGFKFRQFPDGRYVISIPQKNTVLTVLPQENGTAVTNSREVTGSLTPNTTDRSLCQAYSNEFGLNYMKTDISGGKMGLMTWMPQISSIEAVELVDNFIYFCGYSRDNVDK